MRWLRVKRCPVVMRNASLITSLCRWCAKQLPNKCVTPPAALQREHKEVSPLPMVWRNTVSSRTRCWNCILPKKVKPTNRISDTFPTSFCPSLQSYLGRGNRCVDYAYSNEQSTKRICSFHCLGFFVTCSFGLAQCCPSDDTRWESGVRDLSVWLLQREKNGLAWWDIMPPLSLLSPLKSLTKFGDIEHFLLPLVLLSFLRFLQQSGNTTRSGIFFAPATAS